MQEQWTASDDGLSENARELIEAENKHAATEQKREAKAVAEQPDTEEK